MHRGKIVLGAAIICTLAGCSSVNQTRTGVGSMKPPTATPPVRTPAATDASIYLQSVKAQMQLKWSDNFVQGLGLEICQWLDGGADLNYVGAKTIPWVTSAGGTTNDAAIVVDDAVINICPEHQRQISGH